MGFPLYIAKRYLFTRSKNNAINIITSIAAAGVVIGSLCLFVVLSGFSGLKEFSLQYTTIIDPDLKVSPVMGKTITLDASTLAKLDQIAEKHDAPLLLSPIIQKAREALEAVAT